MGAVDNAKEVRIGDKVRLTADVSEFSSSFESPVEIRLAVRGMLAEIIGFDTDVGYPIFRFENGEESWLTPEEYEILPHNKTPKPWDPRAGRLFMVCGDEGKR